MRAGELRHRVTIRKKTDIDDGHHGWNEEAIVIARRAPANVVELSGRALERAQQIDPRATHLVQVRFHPAIASGQELVFHDGRRGDRLMEIVGPPIDPSRKHRSLDLTCKEAA